MQTKKVFLAKFLESFYGKVRNTSSGVVLVGERRKSSPNSCVWGYEELSQG